MAKDDFVAALLDADQRVFVTFGWHHPAGTAALLGAFPHLGQGTPVEVVLEPSGTYGDALVW